MQDEKITAEINLHDEQDLPQVMGELSGSLTLIEESFGVEANFRGSKVMFRGEADAVERAKALVKELVTVRHSGIRLSRDDLRGILDSHEPGTELSLHSIVNSNVVISGKKRLIMPKTRTQAEYIEAIKHSDMVFGIGPAGTGKTYLAMAMAINALLKKLVSRVVLARPAVEAGERLGFLPGDMIEKINPYLRPLYDALYDMMDVERANRLIEKGVIEIAPLAFMRGRTLNDAFIILDEAQNTTREQMKMYLTRLGFKSKTVITGDVTQIDLPHGKPSGLVEAARILQGIDGIRQVYFSGRDVVRHKLVQEIIKAYDFNEKRQEERVPATGDTQPPVDAA